MTENTQTEAKTPVAEAQQDVAKAEATSTANASDELSEDDLEAVAGGNGKGSQQRPPNSER